MKKLKTNKLTEEQKWHCFRVIVKEYEVIEKMADKCWDYVFLRRFDLLKPALLELTHEVFELDDYRRLTGITIPKIPRYIDSVKELWIVLRLQESQSKEIGNNYKSAPLSNIFKCLDTQELALGHKEAKKKFHFGKGTFTKMNKNDGYVKKAGMEYISI